MLRNNQPRAAARPSNDWMSLQQAAAHVGVSVDTLRRRIASGALPAVRVGGRLIRVRAIDVERLLRSIPTAGPSVGAGR